MFKVYSKVILYIPILFQILFHYRLLQDIEYSAMGEDLAVYLFYM